MAAHLGIKELSIVCGPGEGGLQVPGPQGLQDPVQLQEGLLLRLKLVDARLHGQGLADGQLTMSVGTKQKKTQVINQSIMFANIYR